MAKPKRGDVWLVDMGYAAKVRPALVLSIPIDNDERVRLTGRRIHTRSWTSRQPHVGQDRRVHSALAVSFEDQLLVSIQPFRHLKDAAVERSQTIVDHVLGHGIQVPVMDRDDHRNEVRAVAAQVGLPGVRNGRRI